MRGITESKSQHVIKLCLDAAYLTMINRLAALNRPGAWMAEQLCLLIPDLLSAELCSVAMIKTNVFQKNLNYEPGKSQQYLWR